MLDGPVIDLSQVILVNKFGESLAPIMPYGFFGGGSTGDEFGKVGAEIVAAALEELGGEVRGPVGSVGFEGVGEDGVGWGVAEGFEERFADGFEVGGDGLVAEGIEDPAFGADGGALDLLSGVATDKEECHAGNIRFFELNNSGGATGAADEVGEWLGGGCVPVLRLAVYQGYVDL
jgi:hypothetical protein